MGEATRHKIYFVLDLLLGGNFNIRTSVTIEYPPGLDGSFCRARSALDQLKLVHSQIITLFLNALLVEGWTSEICDFLLCSGDGGVGM